MKIYASTGYIGEGCFDIELFNDKDDCRIGLWSNGTDVQYTEDVYTFDLDAHPYSNVNLVKLMHMCSDALKRSDVGVHRRIRCDLLPGIKTLPRVTED